MLAVTFAFEGVRCCGDDDECGHFFSPLDNRRRDLPMVHSRIHYGLSESKR